MVFETSDAERVLQFARRLSRQLNEMFVLALTEE